VLLCASDSIKIQKSFVVDQSNSDNNSLHFKPVYHKTLNQFFLICICETQIDFKKEK
jgi:hypothetical protein